MTELVHRSWLKLDATRAFAYYFCSVVSLGVLPLVCFYHPHIFYQVSTIACAPEEAQFVHVSFCDVEQVCEVGHYVQNSTGEHLLSIEVENIRYCASNRNKYTFCHVPDVPIHFKRFLFPHYDMVHSSEELQEEARLLKFHYGQNIMKIPETNFFEILVRYLLSPFYLFQYFSVSIWIVEDYWVFAMVILLITLLAIYVTASESLSNLENLRKLAGVHNDVQRLKRVRGDDIEIELSRETVEDSCLVSGDKIIISEHMTIPCDVILISGKVVVDESMLTGESVPVGKVQIDLEGLAGDENYILTHGTLLEDYSRFQKVEVASISNKSPPIGDKNGDTLVKDFEIATKRGGSVLFAGTRVKATFGDECIGIVYRTGYRSAKGSLILALLKPKNDFISFVSDALWVLLVMVIFCTVLYCFSAIILVNKADANTEEIVFWYFDALTCAVPSALIASLSIATTVSIGRLKDQQIFVSDTTRVNYAGVINAVCFDKTGTLTDESLSYHGLLLARKAVVSGQTSVTLEEHPADIDGTGFSMPEICQEIMATCHGLFLYGLQDGLFSSPTGDPLEMELFRATGWKLMSSSVAVGRMLACPPSAGHSETGAFVILKHFEFSPDRLRAASLVQTPTGQVKYFVKGSPEMILSLCDPDSIPSSIQEALLSLARKGLRVLAIAAREFDEGSLSSSNALQLSQSACEESHLQFVGLVYLSNQLKDSTHRTISALHAAKIHTAMITGDHIFTAIAVAEECGILTPVSQHVSTTTAASATPGERIFIVDFDQVQHRLVTIDATTEKIEDATPLPQLIYLAAQTSLQDIHHDLAAHHHHRDLARVSVSNVFPKVQLAVTGRGLMAVRVMMPDAFASLVRYAKVFARTKPMEKKLIVETLMKSPEFDNLAGLSSGLTLAAASRPVSSVSSEHQQDETSSLLHNEASSLPTSSTTSSSSTSSSSSTVTNRTGSTVSFSFCSSSRSLEAEEILQSPMDVSFCGDGANDMIALRAATVGVSLCDAETSVAAPITSQKATPYAVVDVIREGRCSLITAYVLILFNVMYATVQLFFVNSGYFFGMQASAWSYLIQDLFFGLVLGVVTSYTDPTSVLSMTMPPKRFLKFYLLFRLFSNLFLFVGFQCLALYIVSRQSFYTSSDFDSTFGESYGYPTAVAQHMALGQIMIASVVSSIGYPFRRAWYRNVYHVIALVVQFGWLLFQIFDTDDWFLQNILDLKPVPVYFGFVLLLLLLVNLLACLGITELGDFYFLQSTNQRWFEIVSLSDIIPPDLSLSRKKFDV